jgi:hypothetical protein
MYLLLYNNILKLYTQYDSNNSSTGQVDVVSVVLLKPCLILKAIPSLHVS